MRSKYVPTVSSAIPNTPIPLHVWFLTARRTGTRVKTPRPRVGLIRSNLAVGLSRTVTFFETVDRLHRSEDLHAENLIGLTNVELAKLVLISGRSLRLVKRILLALF